MKPRSKGAQVKRRASVAQPTAPTLVELAARVTWLEECQKTSVETVEALRAQVTTLADQVTVMEWRRANTDAQRERMVLPAQDVAQQCFEISMKPEDHRWFDMVLFVLAVAAVVGLGWMALYGPWR